VNREQGDALKALVRTYLDAYDERMHPAAPGAAPRLWADRPIRAEYRAVLDHVLALPVAERHYSKESIEELVDGLLTETLRDRARVDAEVDGLADLFNHQIVTRLYVPLEGVASDAPVYDAVM